MKNFMKCVIAVLIVSAAAPCLRADDRLYNEEASREYRAAKRQQVGEVLELWLPTWRPGAVGTTYLKLGDRLSSIDTANCSPRLRMHIKKAECICTKLGEECVLASKSEIVVALTPFGPALKMDSSSDRTRGSMNYSGELATSEDVVLQELMLSE